jgi:hypothetical protein
VVSCLAIKPAINLAEPTIILANLAISIAAVPVLTVVREAQRVIIHSPWDNFEAETQKRFRVHMEVGRRINVGVGANADRVFGGIEDVNADLVVVLGRVLLLILEDVDAAESDLNVSR